MQHTIATKIVGFFARRNLIEKDNVDWCVYFIETRIFSYATLLLFFFPLIANLSSDGNPGLSLIRSTDKATFRGLSL